MTALIEFREAEKTEKDARRVMMWRNDPLTLAMSFHQEPKVWETFWPEYCNMYFSNPRLPPLFALHNSNEIAFLKFSQYIAGIGVPENAVDIGIIIAPEWRNKGLGSIVLREAAHRMLGQGFSAVVAEIKRENAPSTAAFRNAGYVLLDSSYKSIPEIKENIPIYRYVATRQTHPEDSYGA
ncbi:MAG: GNAT family N-acetyltransferase [Candidatus Woesearchaeota archaeon]